MFLLFRVCQLYSGDPASAVSGELCQTSNLLQPLIASQHLVTAIALPTDK